MDRELINKIIDSLLSDDVDKEYLNYYVNNENIRKECDKLISEKLYDELSNGIYEPFKYINFLNNGISELLNEKPYLSEINIISRTISEKMDEVRDNYYLDKNKNEKKYASINANLTKMLAVIDDEFVLKNEFNNESESKFLNKYMHKLENNEVLTKEEVEDLSCFYFYMSESPTKKYLLDNIIKTLLEEGYKIDKYLYRNIFLHSCDEIFEQKKLNNTLVNFDHKPNLKYAMRFNKFENLITISSKDFYEHDIFDNYITFFHEIRHYEQSKSENIDLMSLKIAKEDYVIKYLDRLYKDNKYYDTNYFNLYSEKDADYSSFKDAYNFIVSKCPSQAIKMKYEIYRRLKELSEATNPRINERVFEEKQIDSDLLFDFIVEKSKPDFVGLSNIIYCKRALLTEYDTLGNKRDIFNLLEIKNDKDTTSERIEVIDYLFNNEKVSREYIEKNIKLFDQKETKLRYSNYYAEAARILKNMTFRYIHENNIEEDDLIISMFNAFERSNISISSMDNEYTTENEYNRETELRKNYNWLYRLKSEVEEEQHIDSNTKTK